MSKMFSRDELHHDIARAAMRAAHDIRADRHSVLRMEPGDATRYDIVVVRLPRSPGSSRQEFLLGVYNFGGGLAVVPAIPGWQHSPVWIGEELGIDSPGSANVMADFANLLCALFLDEEIPATGTGP